MRLWTGRPIPLLTLATLALVFPLPASGQPVRGPGSVVTGRVLAAETGEPLADVVVSVEGRMGGVLSDSLGRYLLDDVRPGPRVLRATRLGFATARIQVTVPARGVLTRDIELAVQALAMQDITVTADAAGRARGELGTASVIEREAIEHLTATSLAQVLQLVPGVSASQPGLDAVEQISLRFAPTTSSLFESSVDAGTTRSARELASFGTLIVLDGVPLSNNANLQTLGPRGELSFPSTSGGGVDLRQIPASTIERVEVIRGLPSVRYGDLTQGAIVVDTRAASVAPIVNGKFDPRTLEGSVVGGRSFGGERHAGTLTFDATRTASQPGVSDDVASRFTAQLAHRAELGATARGEPRLTLDTRFDLFQLIDDRPENPDVRPERAFRSRDRSFRLSERARLALSPDWDLRFTGSMNVLDQDSESRAPQVAGAQPFTDRLTEGRSEGRFIGGRFISRVDVDGEPWLFFSRLETEGRERLLGADHEIRAGAVLRREWNTGPGLQFDIQFPPQVSFNGIRGYDRPRSYDEVPPLVTSAFYIGDLVSARLGPVPANLQAGLRLDLLHEGGSWLAGVRDELLQPRFNGELLLRPWLRLRGGWGRTAKVPNLIDLFPSPQYFDLVNVNFFANDPAERLAVLTTFIRDPTKPDLGMSRATKAEVGFEIGSGDVALSLVAFRDRVDGAVGIAGEPDFLPRENFDLEDTLGDGMPPEVIEPAASVDTIPILVDRPGNIFDLESEGLELTASLPEFEPLATRLHVTGAWIDSEVASEALFFGTASEFQAFQLLPQRERTPFWDGLTETGEKMIFLYRAIHHQPSLGLVISATVEHFARDRFRDEAGTDTLSFAGFLTRDGQLVRVPREERTSPEFADLRKPRRGASTIPQSSPPDWRASIQVSKTLPADGKLNFWAFNLFDRRGAGFEPGIRPRFLAPLRFGFEVTFPTRRWLGS